MTYATFLLSFVLAPLAASLWLLRHELGRGWALAMLPLLAVVYLAATPWDAAAVRAGLWSFPPARLLGPWVLGVPLEEFLFIGLQTLTVGLWASRALRRARLS